MATENEVRAWVRDENERVVAQLTKTATDAINKLEAKPRAEPLTGEARMFLTFAAIVATVIISAIYGYVLDPSDAEECAELCKPTGVAKFGMHVAGQRPLCECK